MSDSVLVGLEVLEKSPEKARSWGRCGLLSNQASITLNYTPAWAVCQKILGKDLTTLFGPQHGFAGTAQDNMIETGHARHLASGLPIYSLYSETREPTPAMFDQIDTLIIDLQITGCRIYTWKSTIAGCLRTARKTGKRIVVLDRPNPVGGIQLEGRVLDDDCHSFVGQFPTPMRHGLTAAESALYFNSFIGADLEVVAMEKWNPSHYWHQLGRPYVLTSPNLPTTDPVYVYPGTVMLEGTNISEGRGTGLPFQLIGAPYVQSGQQVIDRIRDLTDETRGLILREAAFEPVAQKWKGEVCNGLQIHVTEPAAVRSFIFTLALIKAFMDVGDGFAWKQPPYEYDHETLPIKLIVGSRKVEDHLNEHTFDARDPFWHEGVEGYISKVSRYLMYPRILRAPSS
jgi:uncharacterized protein YbbC (DUF1343 family)